MTNWQNWKLYADRKTDSEELLWTWIYKEGDYQIIQDQRNTIFALLTEIDQQGIIDDGAANWIEFDGCRVAAIDTDGSILIGA